MQLELRDGAPWPDLGRDAGLWLRSTGVRALRNMYGVDDAGAVAGPESGRTSPTHRLRGLARTGFLATLAPC
ncbi:hypothetical protein [Streptomyces sp. BA2]|uniref:hypothetical protein n=1 Tax=Streptomyces sp. BA2 TaxID=436595 RepID=UPI00192235BB|nr:hypothetical protein [Streptomyces sp. BA2]